MKSYQGHFLIASPHLNDPNFLRAVVLLIQHSDEGAFGVILNRPIDKTIQELWEEVNEPPCTSQKHLNLGGPVSGPLMAVHNQEAASEAEILPGIFFSAQKEHLEALVAEDPPQLKLFVGHSGWGAGQLEHELKQGAWMISAATPELVFLEEEHLWQRLTRQLGQAMLVSVLKIKHVPDDPNLN